MRRPSGRPNVLVLHTDQQRFDTIATAGNPAMHTPNLDRVAAQIASANASSPTQTSNTSPSISTASALVSRR